MKLKGLFPIFIILPILYLSAISITAENDGLRAIGFVIGVICGSLLNMWLDDNL